MQYQAAFTKRMLIAWCSISFGQGLIFCSVVQIKTPNKSELKSSKIEKPFILCISFPGTLKNKIPKRASGKIEITDMLNIVLDFLQFSVNFRIFG
jgi:hypothetical protein